MASLKRKYSQIEEFLSEFIQGNHNFKTSDGQLGLYHTDALVNFVRGSDYVKIIIGRESAIIRDTGEVEIESFD